MIPIKTKEEIAMMKEGGRRLRRVLDRVAREAKPETTTKELNNLAQGLIKKEKGTPSFKMIKGYNWATCMCVNDCVVHGVPNERKLKENDILTIDVGMYYGGFHTDTALTIKLKSQNSKVKTTSQISKVDNFLKTGKEALVRAISQVRPGNRVGHISKAIQETVERGGYNVVRQLVGHGIGRKLHEPPEIPCFLNKKIEDTPLLKEDMTLAIEVIYNMGGSKVVIDEVDGWTIRTKDGKIAASFEKTVAVMCHGPLVLT